MDTHIFMKKASKVQTNAVRKPITIFWGAGKDQ
jgi:hypothetical protein